ncbi:MAG: ABC transporter permease [Nonomuraea sp.]|nr:ABC transporter permease [Nonomuraea sp.]
MRALLLILGKDLRQRVRDRSLFVMALLAPFGLAVVFSLVFRGAETWQPPTFAVSDADGGQVATAFTTQALRPLEQRGQIKLRIAASEREARDLVARREAEAAFLIPPGFTAAVLSARPATMLLVGGPDAPLGSFVARSIADSFAARVHYAQVAVVTGGAGDPQSTPEPVRIADTPALAGKQLSLSEGFAAGMAVFFLFFTVDFGFGGILDERRDGTLARLLAAPVSPYTVAIAKLATGAVVGVASTAVLLLAATLLLGATWGNPVGVGALVLAGVLAATGVMALAASLARTDEQARALTSIVAVVLGVVGGVFLPSSMLGGAFETASLLTPHRWFLRGLADLGGGGLPAVVTPVLVLLGIAAVTIALTLTRVRRMLRP